MGANAIATIAIGLVLMTCSFYFHDDAREKLSSVLKTVGLSESHIQNVLKFLRLPVNTPETRTKTEGDDELKTNLFTPEELLKFDGSSDSKGLYLAILGEVFNVEKGAQHYKPGGGYAFFTGKDATRAYITGDFSENGLIDDVNGLDDASLKGIEDWLSFYTEEYELVGKVIGRYYDENGNPTKELTSVQEKIAHNKKNKWLEDKEKEIFPPCNSEWSKSEGSKVWCTTKSGGIDREWTGVPRLLYKQGKDPRCVCVKDTGPPLTDPEAKDHSDRGDLDYPELKEYPNCASTSQTCKVN